MKYLFSLLCFLLVSSYNSFGQCSVSPNNFEIQLTPSGNNNLLIQIRYSSNRIENSESKLPTKSFKFDGLVFAVTWPTTSNVNIQSVQSLSKPFDIIMDNGTTNNSVARVANDNIATFVHNVSMPTEFGFNWKQDTWYDVASISYSGKLQPGDYFSLLTCDYGMANPNSYYGNSTTDPWLSIINEEDFYQFSPKMITNTPNNIVSINKYNIYPNPTKEDLNIDIESQVATQVAINISDLSGKVVKNIVFKIEKGSNNTIVNLSELAQGNYMVKITDGKAITYTKQITKL